MARLFWLHTDLVWKAKAREYDLHELQFCLLSRLEGLSDEDAKSVATSLDLEHSEENIAKVVTGKYISDLNSEFGTAIGIIPEEAEWSPLAYDIADVIKGVTEFQRSHCVTEKSPKSQAP